MKSILTLFTLMALVPLWSTPSFADDEAEAERDALEERKEAEIDAIKTRNEAEREAREMKYEAEKEKAEAEADAESSSEARVRARASDPLGAYVSLWGDPYPSPVGVNVAYNVSDFARLTLGVGSNSDKRFTVSNFGVGAKFMVPGWRLTPIVGVNLSMSSNGGESERSIRGFDPEGPRVYGTAGLDWQTAVGLNLAAGYAQSLRSGEDGTVFLNLGFFL